MSTYYAVWRYIKCIYQVRVVEEVGTTWFIKNFASIGSSFFNFNKKLNNISQK